MRFLQAEYSSNVGCGLCGFDHIIKRLEQATLTAKSALPFHASSGIGLGTSGNFDVHPVIRGGGGPENLLDMLQR